MNKNRYLSYISSVFKTVQHLSMQHPFLVSISISWLYGICEQIAIPLPFNRVPIIILQILLFALPEYVGWHAFSGYCLFFLQGILGAPFFAHGNSGLVYACGPTGGYLVGMGMASLWLVLMYRRSASVWYKLFIFECANLFIFAFGLAHLSLFVPRDSLLAVGFMPFAINDFILKPVVALALTKKNK